VTAETRTIRILIADDHVTVREGLAAIIARQADMKCHQRRREGLSPQGRPEGDAPRDDPEGGSGETCIPPELVSKLAAGMSSEVLTSREQEVLQLLAHGKSNAIAAATRRGLVK
jgi:DNA-binding NarL/FixJ family response regulator